MAERRSWIEPGHELLSVRRQFALLGLYRSNWYYEPAPESVENLRLLRSIDELYIEHPHLGSHGLVAHLARRGVVVSSAYERQSLIVTTNLPFAQWTEVLGSERLTGAVLDRLTHRCHILESTGESYHLQDARRRRKGSRPKPAPSSSSPADELAESWPPLQPSQSFLLRRRKDSYWNAPKP